MPVPYDQRRQRRQQLAEELPSGLHGRIALRNVETVAKFPPDTQQKLAEAISDDRATQSNHFKEADLSPGHPTKWLSMAFYGF